MVINFFKKLFRIIANDINSILVFFAKKILLSQFKRTRVSKFGTYDLEQNNLNLNILSNYYVFELPFYKDSGIYRDVISFPVIDERDLLIYVVNNPMWYRAIRESGFFANGLFEAWCEENCNQEWGRIEGKLSYYYLFKDSQDATLFKIFFQEYIE